MPSIPFLRGLSLRRGSSLRDVAALGGGTAVGQILVVLSAPVITRIYRPADIGVAGIFMSFVDLAAVSVGLRYELGIVSARSGRERDWLLTATLLMMLPISALASIGLDLLIRNDLLSFGELPRYAVPLGFLALILSGAFQTVRYWLVRCDRYLSVSRGLVGQGAGRAILPLALGPLHAGWIGLLAGELGGRLAAIGVVVASHHRDLRTALRIPRRRFRKAVLARHWKLPAVVLPSTVLETLGGSITAPLVASLFGTAAAGEFVLVNRFSWVPVGFIAASVADVFHARAARASEADPGNVRVLLRKLSLRLLLTGLAVFVPVMIAAPFVFGPVLGSEWKRSGLLMTILAPVSIAGLVVSPASRLLLVVNRSELKMVVDVIRLVLPVGVVLLMHRAGLGFMACMAGLSATWVVSYLIYFVLIWKASAAPPGPGTAPPEN